MDYEQFLREANTKPDYNTNAGSYYKDLARKQELIKLLAKKIWDYEQILDDTLDDLSLRLESYINENDSLMSDRLKNWDERIENLDEEVSHIFVEWLNDGTLEQIINHDVLGNKADKADLDNRGVNINWYALEVVDGDWTSVIQKVLDTHKHAVVPSGDFQVNNTIELKQGQILELQNNAKLIKRVTSDNTLPVVWLKSNYDVLRGHNRMTSRIVSEKETPFGVVCLGYLGMTDTIAKNVLYCTIVDVGIYGHQNGGNLTGTPSLVLNLANPQIDNMASYFHSLDRLYIANGNVGLMLEGYANANIIGDIQFYKVGDNKYTNDSGAIVLKNTDGKGPLDNIINGIFHHTSINADTLVFDGYSHYNVLSNINSEQGGTLARWYYIKNTDIDTTPVGNIISGISNVAGGTSQNEHFRSNNVVLGNYQIGAKGVTADTLRANTSVTTNKLHYQERTSPYVVEKFIDTVGLSENKTYKILEIDTSNIKGSTGTIDFSINTAGAVDGFIQSYVGQAIVKTSVSGVATITLGNLIETRPDMLVSGVVGNKVYLGVKILTNGTNATTIGCRTFYTVKGKLAEGVIKEYVDNSGLL